MPDPRHNDDLAAQVSDLLRAAATQFILPRFRALGDQDIQTKTHANDLVTIADIEAEAWLAKRLCALIPASQALGEEATSRGEINADVLTTDDPVWTIDPVDGTYNFVNGSKDFCTMVALVHRGLVQDAWIYFPTSDAMYQASRGQGTFFQSTRDTQHNRCELSSMDAADLATLPATISHRFWRREDLKPQKSAILDQLGPIAPTNCAGLHYSQVVDGKTSLTAMTRLTPWDHAPGTLLVQEAGGEVQLDSGPYDPSVAVGTLISGAPSPRKDLAARLLA